MEELIIKEHQIREKLVQTINDAELPAFILEPIIKDIYNEINKIKEQQYNNAILNQQQIKEKKGEKKNG